MEWLLDPAAWVGLLTLVVLEIVLGIDNLIFIAILADKLPPSQRDRARILGLSLALVMRLGLLSVMSWLVTLTTPLFSVGPLSPSGRDLILMAGGFFLLFKGTMELHERLEGGQHGGSSGPRVYASFWVIVTQIVVLDAVFSLDSVITAVGMVDHLAIMMIAVVIAIGIMLLASKPLTRFVNAHPTVVVLCLGFLLMIGFSLLAEAFGFKVPKGYLYAAIGFSILIELANQAVRWRRRRSLQGSRGPRERTRYAVLRLLGGKVEADEVGEEIADMLGEEPADAPFDRRERVLISGVLELAERSIRTVMTERTEVHRIDLDADAAQTRQVLLDSPYSRLLVIRAGQVDEPLGYVHKKELLKPILAGRQPDIEPLLRVPLNLPDSCSVLGALEQMRQASTHVAFVVNEFGGFEGLLTLTDILQAIAGELPDASEMTGPDIEKGSDGWRVRGTTTLALLAERIGFRGQAPEDCRTLGGLALHLLDRLPAAGDELEHRGWRLRVLEVKERRVERLLLQPPRAA